VAADLTANGTAARARERDRERRRPWWQVLDDALKIKLPATVRR